MNNKTFIVKKIRGILSLALVLVCIGAMVPANAASHNFSGSLKLRLLDGSSNAKYYTIPASKTVKMSGTAKVTRNKSLGNATTTYGHLYEGAAGGKGTSICSTSFKASSGSKSFSASGKTKKQSSKYYMYFYRAVDDGRELDISGKLTY